MNQLPDKLWLRRSEVRTYLGISRQALGKLIAAQVLKPKYFPGQTHAYYDRADVAKIKPEAKAEPILQNLPDTAKKPTIK